MPDPQIRKWTIARCARCGGPLDGRRAARMLKARGIVREQEAKRGE